MRECNLGDWRQWSDWSRAIGASVGKTSGDLPDQRPPGHNLPSVTARFESPEDLRQLDEFDIEVVAHLAGVTGRCTEQDALIVNVEGSRCLMRYLLDHGCRKFVMASSTAVVGFQREVPAGTIAVCGRSALSRP